MQPRPVDTGHEPTSDGLALKPGERGRGPVRKAVALTLAGICLLLPGCSAATVWRAEAASPDGRYKAIAQTLQNGGPGNAWIGTSVYLEQTNIPETRTVVLDFSCGGPVPRPFTLDNVANAGGTIDLKMKWLTPTHLEVTYDGLDGTLNFQAVKYQAVEISVRDISGWPSDTSQ